MASPTVCAGCTYSYSGVACPNCGYPAGIASEDNQSRDQAINAAGIESGKTLEHFLMSHDEGNISAAEIAHYFDMSLEDAAQVEQAAVLIMGVALAADGELSDHGER